MPALRRWGGTSSMARSSNRMLPASGRMKPAIMRSSVVLPQPEGPSRKNSSPRSTVKETSVTAGVSPYRLVTA